MLALKPRMLVHRESTLLSEINKSSYSGTHKKIWRGGKVLGTETGMMHLTKLKGVVRSVGKLPTPSDLLQQWWGHWRIKCWGLKCLAQNDFAPPFLEEDLVLIPLCLSLSSKIVFKVNFFF